MNPIQAKSEEEEVIVIADPPPPPPRKVLGVPLVPDADNLLRWWSMRWLIAAAVAETLPRAWATIPPEWVPPMPGWLEAALGVFVLVAIPAAAVSRIVQQAKP